MLVFTKALDKHWSKDFVVALRANSNAEDDLESKRTSVLLPTTDV